MSNITLYRRFLNLCEKWPKDPTKEGRDYSEVIRRQIGQKFPHGELGETLDAEWTEKQLASLERIANESYFKEEKIKKSSATGAGLALCRQIGSNQAIKELGESIKDEQTIMARLKNTLSMKFEEYMDKRKRKSV